MCVPQDTVVPLVRYDLSNVQIISAVDQYLLKFEIIIIS